MNPRTPRRPPPNERMMRTALHLQHLAPRVTDVVTHIHDELARSDGYPAGAGGGRVSGGDTTDPTSRAADQRYRLTAYREDIRDAITDLGDRAVALDRLLTKASGVRMPEPPAAVALCRDGLHGKDLSPRLTADVAVCCDIPHRSGLCTKHWYRWYRERRDDGVSVDDMHEQGAA